LVILDNLLEVEIIDRWARSSRIGSVGDSGPNSWKGLLSLCAGNWVWKVQKVIRQGSPLCMVRSALVVVCTFWVLSSVNISLTPLQPSIEGIEPTTARDRMQPFPFEPKLTGSWRLWTNTTWHTIKWVNNFPINVDFLHIMLKAGVAQVCTKNNYVARCCGGGDYRTTICVCLVCASMFLCCYRIMFALSCWRVYKIGLRTSFKVQLRAIKY